MKKKVLAALLTVSMTAAMLAGCGSNTSAGTAAEGSSAAGAEGTTASLAAEAGTQAAQAEEGESTGSIVTEPTEFTFIFADGDEGAKEVMNSVVEKFNAAYPDITVTALTVNS